MAKLIAGAFLVLVAAGLWLWMGMGKGIDEALVWKNRYVEVKEKIDRLDDKAKQLQSLLGERSKALLEADERYQTLTQKTKQLQSLMGEKSKALLEADERYQTLARETKERLASLEDRFKSEITALASAYELEKVKGYDLAEKIKSLESSIDDQRQSLRNVYR